jgi:hypothetical protein
MSKRSSSNDCPNPKRNKSSERAILAAKIESAFTLAENSCEYCDSIFPTLCWISNHSLKCSNCARDNIPCSMSSSREHQELVSAFSSLASKKKILIAELFKVQQQEESLLKRGLAGSVQKECDSVAGEFNFNMADAGALANGSSAIPQEPQNSS